MTAKLFQRIAPPTVSSARPASGTARFLMESASLYGSLYIFVFLQFISGFLVAKFLGPALYGLRTTFDLVLQYERYTQLGTHEAMHKEVPFHRARGDAETAERILGNVFGVNFLYSLGACAALVAAGFYLRYAGFEPILCDFLLFLGVYTVVTRTKNFYAAQLVIDKRTYVLSQLRVLNGLVAAIASVVLVYYFSLRGLFVALLLANAVGLVYVMRRVRWIPPMRISLRLTGELIRIGFPIMLVGLLFLLFRSVDKLLILSLLSQEMLGYFAVAALISAFVFETLGEVMRVMFFPRLMEKLGRSGDPHAVKSYLTDPTLLLAYFVPFLLGALYLGVHLPLRHLAPEYVPAIAVAKVLMLGYFFFAVMSMPLLVSVALNRQRAVVTLTAAAIVLDAALNYIFLVAGWGLTGVALATGISYFLFWTAVLAFALRQVGGDLRELLRLYGLILLPFAVMLCLLAALDRPTPAEPLGIWEDVWNTATKIGLYCILFALLPFAVRTHPAFVRLRGSLLVLARRRQRGAEC